MYIYIYKYTSKNVLKLIHIWVSLHVRVELEFLKIIISFYLSVCMYSRVGRQAQARS